MNAYRYKLLLGFLLLVGVSACKQSRSTLVLPTNSSGGHQAPEATSPSSAIASQLYPPLLSPPSTLTLRAYPPEELTRIASLPTQTSIPPFTPFPSPTFEPSSTPYIFPTLIATVDATQLPSLLSNAFRVEDAAGVNDHPLKRVTGWESGLRSTGYCEAGPYRWLDDKHIMMLPIAKVLNELGITEFTAPVVIQNETGTLWLPPTHGMVWGCYYPNWSEPLQALIATTRQEVILFTSDGKAITQFSSGSAVYGASYLSPSGLRLLTGAVWRDLQTGQEVDFSVGHDVTRDTDILINPAWSSDETKLFACCFGYADAQTGIYTAFSLPPIELPGRDGPSSGSGGIQNWWILSDTRALTSIDFYDPSDTTFSPVFPLIDPFNQTYTNLGATPGLSEIYRCPFGLAGVAPHRLDALIHCDWSQIIDLQTLTLDTLPNGFDFVSWSPDGLHALFIKDQVAWDRPPIRGYFLIWSRARGASYAMLDFVIRVPSWSPDSQHLAYLSDNGQTLVVLEVETRGSRIVLLPQPFTRLVWNPSGQSLAAVAEDGSVWLATPATGAAEQLTPPLPNLRDVKWSPSGTHLAFVSGPDVYVVEVTP